MIEIKFLDEEKRKQIGWDFVMHSLEVLTPYGLEEKKGIKPFADREKLILELDKIELIISSIQSNPGAFDEIESILKKVKDIRGSIKRCENYEVLDEVELFEIKSFCLLILKLIPAIDRAGLDIQDIRLQGVSGIINLLDPEGTMHPTFYIYDSYSAKLKDLRERKRELESQIRQKKEESTLLELKRLRLDVVAQEEEEELNVRKRLTDSIAQDVEMLKKNIKAVGRLDLLLGKAHLALKYNGVKPEISNNMAIHIDGMFNPEIKELLKSKGKDFSPISISLKSGTTVVTGANMGGKSVALKTLALNVLLAQMGLFAFCKNSMVPILDFVYLISDDMQSVVRGLSSFGAEIVELNEALIHVKRSRGLLLVDEFARGTNPVEGCNLARALCKYLMNFDSISVISTHYDGVADEGMVHYQVVGLKNADFNALGRRIKLNKKSSIGIIQEIMDYSLERVPAGSRVPRDAINICALLGFDQGIMAIARQLYDENDGVKEGKYGQ